jgi:SOS-response transcriptional repressor LexA/DNA-binding XRE family transcriptional regulator
LKIKERLRTARNFLKLSQEALAIATGSQRTTVAGYESGISLPRAEFLRELSIKYGINPNWILTGQGDMLVEASANSKGKSPLEKEVEQIIENQTKDTFLAIETRLTRLEAALKTRTDEAEEDITGGLVSGEPEPEYGAMIDILYVDDIAAGLPIVQSEDQNRHVRVPAGYLKGSPKDYYAAGIRGQSMTEAGIPDGRIVLIRRADAPRDGAIQVIAWQGRSTLKRLKELEGGGWELRYEDGTGRVIELKPGAECRVQGEFVMVLPEGTRPG